MTHVTRAVGSARVSGRTDVRLSCATDCTVTTCDQFEYVAIGCRRTSRGGLNVQSSRSRTSSYAATVASLVAQSVGACGSLKGSPSEISRMLFARLIAIES